MGKHISLIAEFRDSQPYLTQDALHQLYLGRLVEAHNELSDMGNQMYRIFGRPLTVPPRGRFLDATIEKAKADVTTNKKKGGATQSAAPLVRKEFLTSHNTLILSTNLLTNDPPLGGVKTRSL